MKGYLLDTNVVSLLSPSQGEASSRFLSWLDEADAKAELFLSVVTVHEIERGITLLERKGATAKARELRRWMDGLVSIYEDRILPINAVVSTSSGQLEAAAVSSGHSPGMADALIAGTARAHNLTVVTSNLHHFGHFGVDVMPAPV
ncbi:twitching motility protein PilT [Paramesorhizobium deserti]|uniref:Ribonuclease VapC n=1 Tax=Paramesorhizobium deserti TaxID=1494590 RepID=A0A135HNP4_9HYPH|nr:type II toxin-antitoxin system VapC family toxin [Paramesorhizobium deserti]KXF74819.1 twitching motility protein PilT [Paramesorhizobium deserti]